MWKHASILWVLATWLSLACSATATHAQGDAQADELAKKVQNPIANLTTLPFQYNYFWNVGDNDRNSGVINF